MEPLTVRPVLAAAQTNGRGTARFGEDGVFGCDLWLALAAGQPMAANPLGDLEANRTSSPGEPGCEEPGVKDAPDAQDSAGSADRSRETASHRPGADGSRDNSARRLPDNRPAETSQPALDSRTSAEKGANSKAHAEAGNLVVRGQQTLSQQVSVSAEGAGRAITMNSPAANAEPGAVLGFVSASLNSALKTAGVPGANAAAQSAPGSASLNPAPSVRPGVFCVPFQEAGGEVGQIRLTIRGSVLQATVQSSNADTVRRLERNLTELQRAIEGRGFAEARVEVRHVKDPNEARSSGSDSNQNDDPAGHSRHSREKAQGRSREGQRGSAFPEGEDS